MKLQGKVAIVTGASRGIGSALCIALAKEGCAVVAASKTMEPHHLLPGTLLDTVREVEAIGGQALALQIDVRDEQQIEQMVAKTVERFGRVDILINNAGAIFIADTQSTPAKKFDLVMDVNARASFLCAQAVLPHMLKNGGGHILMMSPPIRMDRAPGKPAYALSKIGMTFFAHSLAEEMRDRAIAVNALWPVTMIDSQATRHFWPESQDTWRTPEILCDATIALLTASDPMERSGRAYLDEEVLSEFGVTDLACYNLIPGAVTPPFSQALFDPAVVMS